MPLIDISVFAVATILSFDGSGFDATRVYSPSVAPTNGGYTMLFGGLPFANNIQTGLATAPNHTTWTKSPASPVITNAASPSWDSFREIPITLMHQGGTYKLWFYGNNTNLGSDPGAGNGFGYASSPDGITWTQHAANPIRFGFNGSGQNGYTLNEVTYYGGQYHAFYQHNTNLGSTLYHATSADGVSFGNDSVVAANPTLELSAATTFSNAHGEGFFSIWRATNGTQFYSLSYDSMDFTLDGALNAPAGFDIRDVLVEGDTISFYANTGVGNINWSFGNMVIQYGQGVLPEPIPEPPSFILLCGGLLCLGFALHRRGHTATSNYRYHS